MEIKWNRILFILIWLLTLISCKLYENKKRDKREKTEMEWQHEEQRQRQYSLRKDTLSHLWYFWTDSAFRFHPDSGLFAQSGILLGQESKGSIDKQIQDLTTKNKQGKQKETKQQRNSNKLTLGAYFWPVCTVIVLLLIWRWKGSRLLL